MVVKKITILIAALPIVGTTWGGSTVRLPIAQFEQIALHKGDVTTQEIELANKVAQLKKSTDENQEREECWAVVGVLDKADFNQRKGAFEIANIILRSAVVPYLSIDSGIFIIDWLTTMLDAPDGPKIGPVSDLLKILIEKNRNSFINHKEEVRGGKTPLMWLAEYAQVQSKTRDMGPLFDVLRSFFQESGDLGGGCLDIIKLLAKGPITKDVVTFAKDLAEQYVDFSSVPDGSLKDEIKKIDPSWFLWTVEKAMKELEDAVAVKADMGLIKDHAQKVAKFSLESVKKSTDFETLNKRTLAIIANPEFLKRPGAEDVVNILIWGKTLRDLNEQVMIQGKLRRLLPTYIASVIEQPGGDSKKKTDNLTYFINNGADVAVQIDHAGQKKPILLKKRSTIKLYFCGLLIV